MAAVLPGSGTYRPAFYSPRARTGGSRCSIGTMRHRCDDTTSTALRVGSTAQIMSAKTVSPGRQAASPPKTVYPDSLADQLSGALLRPDRRASRRWLDRWLVTAQLNSRSASLLFDLRRRRPTTASVTRPASFLLLRTRLGRGNIRRSRDASISRQISLRWGTAAGLTVTTMNYSDHVRQAQVRKKFACLSFSEIVPRSCGSCRRARLRHALDDEHLTARTRRRRRAIDVRRHGRKGATRTVVRPVCRSTTLDTPSSACLIPVCGLPANVVSIGLRVIGI